ncbi:MAG: outer membrane protein transport protein [Bdellovibrionales bacterium]|nr:outer membrane protein transport protein [Bdellovibrionales bacterium]
MTKLLLIFLFCYPLSALGSYANFNSILIGERAAGLGGAFTALTGDPSACAFYNPATMSRMEGHTLSAAVNLYNKYATHFGTDQDFAEAPLRINQGTIVPVPSSSGSVYSFRNFALGLSITSPDFNTFTGDVEKTSSNTTFINLRDESLWVGGTISLNLTEKDSIGFTLYYTSHTNNLLTTSRSVNGSVITVSTEEKSFSHNSLVYILGYFRQLSPHWTTGLSVRLPSLPISGDGSLHRFSVSTDGTSTFPDDINSKLVLSRIPAKATFGIAYEIPYSWLVSLDLNYYKNEEYYEFENSLTSDKNTHKDTWNVNLGGEYFFKDWLALRLGLFTNNSSAAEIPDVVSIRMLDHIPMWGFSANVAIYTSKNTRFTLGGYYTGGQGWSTQGISGALAKVPKSVQIFSFLVGTTFQL